MKSISVISILIVTAIVCIIITPTTKANAKVIVPIFILKST